MLTVFFTLFPIYNYFRKYIVNLKRENLRTFLKIYIYGFISRVGSGPIFKTLSLFFFHPLLSVTIYKGYEFGIPKLCWPKEGMFGAWFVRMPFAFVFDKS